MAVAQAFEAQREPVGKRITVRTALLGDPGVPLAADRVEEGVLGHLPGGGAADDEGVGQAGVEWRRCAPGWRW